MAATAACVVKNRVMNNNQHYILRIIIDFSVEPCVRIQGFILKLFPY